MRVWLLVGLIILLPAVLFGGLNPGTYHGEAVVLSRSHDAVVLFDSDGRGDARDGRIDHSWAISSTDVLPPMFYVLKEASVTVESNRITVFSRAGRVALVFDASDGGDDDRTWLPPNFRFERASGFGIVEYAGALELPPLDFYKGRSRKLTGMSAEIPPIEAMDIQYPDPFGDAGGSGGAGSCQSGGPGAVSVSLSCGDPARSCSITCNGNYYACANCVGTKAYCKCVLGF